MDRARALQPSCLGSIRAKRIWHISRSMETRFGNGDSHWISASGISRDQWKLALGMEIHTGLSFFLQGYGQQMPCIRVRVWAAMPA